MTANINDEQKVLEQADAFRKDYQAVRERIARWIVGHSEDHRRRACLFVGGHALLEGVPGLGKTLLIRNLSEALSLDFSRIQFTPDLMPADITGTTIVVEARNDDGTTSPIFQKFQHGPIFAPDRAGRQNQPPARPRPSRPCSKPCRKSRHRRR
ncbi:MAG: AAA family ATPase [Phycisphaerales bacterium]